MTSSWRRNADEALPARGKIVGGYVNMAFQKSEAEMNGFDEAIVLTAGGHVNEASAANVSWSVTAWRSLHRSTTTCWKG